MLYTLTRHLIGNYRYVRKGDGNLKQGHQREGEPPELSKIYR